MTLLINDNPIKYYHTDDFRSTQLGRNYFISHDYLVVKAWFHAMLLYLYIIDLIGSFNYKYTIFFPWTVRYNLAGVLCHHIVVSMLLVA